MSIRQGFLSLVVQPLGKFEKPWIGNSDSTLGAKVSSFLPTQNQHGTLPNAWFAINSSIACTRHLTDFIDYVRDRWRMGYPETISYINGLGDTIDFRKSKGGFKASRDILNVIEILLSRTHKSLFKKMPAERDTTLDVDLLEKLGWWASLDDMQSVLPYNQPRFKQIIAYDKRVSNTVRPYVLSFCTLHYHHAVSGHQGRSANEPTTSCLPSEMVQSIEEKEERGKASTRASSKQASPMDSTCWYSSNSTWKPCTCTFNTPLWEQQQGSSPGNQTWQETYQTIRNSREHDFSESTSIPSVYINC